jgi:hypothetical protein
MRTVHDRVERMKRLAIERDQRMLTIQMVRMGKPEVLFPDLFSKTWSKSVVSNWIDSVAREFAEMIAPLPALNCSAGAMKTQADKARAAKRNLIGAHYWRESQLSSFMVSWCDQYLSYGFAPIRVLPCYETNMPKLVLEDPRGFYFRADRFGNVIECAKVWRETVDKMATLFPEHAHRIRTKLGNYGQAVECTGDELVEVVQYEDAAKTLLYLPDRTDLVLATTANPIGKVLVRVAERPGLFGEAHGQFDQVVWVQLARHRMALLGIEAGVKAVGAPIAVPRDVVEMAVGPDAVIQTERPQDVRRVGIEVPQSTFALQEILEQELRMGARYPEGRAGGIDASVVTGRGVEALMGSFDTQISTAQTVIGNTLARATELAFELDVKVWPTARKRITGVNSGEAYDLTYVPKTHLGDEVSVEVTYGFAAGLAPNAAVVMMLQLRGDGLVDRDTVRRNLPWSIDTDQMQRSLDVEQLNDALKQGVAGLLGGIGPIMSQGQDPRPFLRAAAEIVEGRRNGKDLAELVVAAFAPEVMDPEAAEAAAAAEEEAAATGGAEGGALPMDPNSGLPSGTVPGQAGMPPGGAPDLQTLIAGMRGGRPQLDAAVSRRLPTA